MNCPICGGESRVLDSRPNEDCIKRRRECVECKNRFSTVEIDADYYDSLKPIDKKAVQTALLEGYEDITRRVYAALNIKERKDNG